MIYIERNDVGPPSQLRQVHEQSLTEFGELFKSSDVSRSQRRRNPLARRVVPELPPGYGRLIGKIFSYFSVGDPARIDKTTGVLHFAGCLPPTRRLRLSKNKTTPLEAVLQEALSEPALNALGRKAGQNQRLRVITPFRLALAILAALATRNVESLADLLREFNYQNETQTAYKPFYNRLARKGFATFMRLLLERLLSELALRILEPEPGSPLDGVRDVVIQDGSSFAVKSTLAQVFSGRFTAITRRPSRSMSPTAGFKTRSFG